MEPLTDSQQIIKLKDSVRDLNENFSKLKYKFRNIFPRMKKIEELRATITRCEKLILHYQSTEIKSEKMYNRTMDRMREIEKDYASLFKKWNTTITFFEKRGEKGEWKPGIPFEEEEKLENINEKR